MALEPVPALTHSNRSSPHDNESRVAFALTAEEIREFQEIVRSETGTELDAQEAWARANELVALFRMLIGRIPEDAGSDHDFPSSNVV